MMKLGLSFLVVCFLFIASAAYADPIAGRWSSMSPCADDLQVSNNQTFHLWQVCCDSNVNAYSGMWQKVSKAVYEFITGNVVMLLPLKGTVAVGIKVPLF